MHMIRIHQNLEFKGNRATSDKSNMTTRRKNLIVHCITFINILTTFYNRIIRQNKIKRIKLGHINHYFSVYHNHNNKHPDNGQIELQNEDVFA